MESTPLNLYLFKALESYPYELSEAIESLNYALSYEPENPHALFLMGRIHYEQLGDLEEAKRCFQEALASRLELPQVYPYFLSVLIENEDFGEAHRLLEFALRCKGTHKGLLLLRKGKLLDRTGRPREALSALKEARAYGVHPDHADFLDAEIRRIKRNLPKKKKGGGKKEE